jgi:hypothetical protein
MILFNLKIARTLKRIYLDVNGRYSYIDVYRKLGFSYQTVKIENIHFKGLSYYLGDYLRMP